MKITKCHKYSNTLISALGVGLQRLLHKCLVTNYTCMPKQVVSLKDSATSKMAFLRVLEQALVQSEVGDAFLDDPASSLMQQVAGSSFRTSDFGLQRSEKLAFTSLDAGVSVGVHMVDADTTSTSVDIDANLAFGQNSKSCRNH
ncbi:hypothetical protein Taro_021154, partial [Colocasia esculenta]|nr:hypothetical protein [Colocasia esculenta]